MHTLLTRFLFILLTLQFGIFCLIVLRLSFHYFGATRSSIEEFNTLVQNFVSKSSICSQELPTQESYTEEYGAKIGDFLWNYVRRHREVRSFLLNL
jgi:hypothetical protein